MVSLCVPSDELTSCLDCDGLVGGLCDDSLSSGTVRRSLSAPQPPSLDPASSVASCDSQSKYHRNLVARNGSDIYRYPSPLHAVSVQSPAFLQALGHGGREEAPLRSGEAGGESFPLPVSAPLVSQSFSWPAPSSSSSQMPPHKRLDGYIYGLLQRRAPHIRTSRPRTSICTEPSKSVLRQASLCRRTLRGPRLAAAVSPQRQQSVDSKPEEQQDVFTEGGVDTMAISAVSQIQSSCPLSDGVQDANTLLKLKNKRLPPVAASTAAPPKDFRELGVPRANSSPKHAKPPCFFPEPEVQSATPKHATKRQTIPTETADRSASLGSSSQSPEDAGGHMVNAKYIPAQRQSVKLRKGGSKNVKTVKMKTSLASEHNEPPSGRRGEVSHHCSMKSRPLDNGGSVRVSRRAAGGGSGHATSSSRISCLPASIPEGRVLDKHSTSTLSSVRSSRHHHHGNHHHHHHRHHGRDQVVVVAKPKYKRNDYRRLRAIMEVPYDEAFRRTQRRQRKELLSRSHDFVPAAEQASSQYAYVAGSDSEYSAECASLFHSTIVDTSEDERSNYTANRFGDSESSEEDAEESSAASDTEESGGGGTGRGQSQLAAAGAAGQEVSAAQVKAFVKIKASHNLKRKILRFRSGSLKLMTTV
ncbi:dapper homolog 1 [Plectropomus leopardus]|uniref:dapper homolog 1 n=1 Tax=Plectropomus leopardus TaxID=160734 RepID=UPI001C4CDD0E|nr:dapper homolog 1 [Plectropomus leopardus]